MGKIYFQTTAYNAEKTLRRCVDSVLNQTYRNEDIIYYFRDNGSTDHTGEMIREYAEKDPRIRLFTNKKNRVWEPQNREYSEFYRELNDEDVLCLLDSDDAYELNFLEEILPFMEQNQLDIAVCGTTYIAAANNRKIRVSAPETPLLFLNPKELADGFAAYHFYMRPLWGKVFTGKVVRQMYTRETLPEYAKKLTYGSDTFYAFSALRHAERIGIYHKALHRYYAFPTSDSYQWNPNRILSDRILYDDAVDYLSAFGPISAQNRWFLQAVYFSAVTDTINVIRKSSLAPEDKLREYRNIAFHPMTQAEYREGRHSEAIKSRELFVQASLHAGQALKKQGDEDLRDIMCILFPHSGRAVSSVNAQLFLEDQKLFEALLQDDAETILRELLTRIETNQAVKKYAIAETVQALAADNPLLCQIGNAAFLRKYAKMYLLVWQGETLAALEEMTGVLLEDRVSSGQETFLQLYISLSAVLEQVPAFIYGKLKLAQLYFQQKRLPECRAIITDLEEMGLTDSEELNTLRRDLEAADS